MTRKLSDDDIATLSLLQKAAEQYEAYTELTKIALHEVLQETPEAWEHDPNVPLSLTVYPSTHG